MFYRGKLVHI